MTNLIKRGLINNPLSSLTYFLSKNNQKKGGNLVKRILKIKGEIIDLSTFKNIVFIVLGKNWNWNTNPLELSDDSKISTLALGYHVKKAIGQGLDVSVVFSTGHTAGSKYISEAEAMYRFYRSKFDIESSKVSIFLEEESLDTIGNAKMVKKNIDQYIFDSADKICIITVSYHMKRSEEIFKQSWSDKIFSINADKIVNDQSLLISNEDREFISNRTKRFDFYCVEPIKEFILRLIRKFDRQGKFIGWLAKKVRS